MTQQIRLEAVYPHAIEHVWDAVATSHGLAAWLMPNNFEPEIGRAFTFTSEPMPGFDGIISCRVLECVPNDRLSFSWSAAGIDTVVTFILSPFGSSTRLVLEHSGFGGEQGLRLCEMLENGWNKKLLRENLPLYLERAVLRAR